MALFELELECFVKAYVPITIEAENEEEAEALGREAVNCFNAVPQLTIPDVISKAMPKNPEWVIDNQQAENWELVAVNDAD